ncbi:DUF2779 domain-containing protein [Wenzhouxiangella sp. XN79A]|uniref:DUF2779 domain-containing protein n=1 Tax=Wenzhouxiangella sp. XN79A TaxID=2724193 RepID=UPI0023F8408A|nr:DUF2779 domain-containing protein [Wenzhouxiangella sp. XN79A]
MFHGPVDLLKAALQRPIVRQRLQIEAARNERTGPIFLPHGFRSHADPWEWPLHFIDFETCTPAIPLHAGMRPYETIAFQFSHHILHEDGRVEHHSEWLNPDPGVYPHFAFLRNLRQSLGESGTIFRWAPHENTVLNHIADQIERDDHGEPDAAELIEWIRQRTQRGHGKDRVFGEKNMVDQRQLAMELTFDPAIQGLTGIKRVLLSTIRHSEHLQDLYGKPVYGTAAMPSRNFEAFQWFQPTEHGIRDPYELLPPITLGPDGPDIAHLDEEFEPADQLKNGGAAMSAYLEIAAPGTTETRRANLRVALLKYCELDTLAMVMIMQDWLTRS